MANPDDIDKNTLAPQIIIKNLAGTEQYRFETDQVSASPTQDFDLTAMHIHYGVNDDHGNAIFEIWDNDDLLTTSDANKDPVFKNQWTVEVFLGKDIAGLQRWFIGKILEAEVFRPLPNVQRIRIFCVGWGIRAVERVSNISRYQAKQADGITLDDTDTAARASEIFKDIWEDTDHSPYRGFTTESDVTVHVPTIDVKFADFVERYQTFAHMGSRLAGAIGGYWFMDWDKNVHLHQINSEDSGFLFTNEFTSETSKNWDSTKIGIIKRQTFSWKNSSIDSGYSTLHGVGTTVNELDQNLDPSVNAVYNMDSNHVAVQFAPTQSSLSKVALKLQRTGTLTEDAFIDIAPVSSTPDPIDTDLIKRVRIPVEKLQALGTSTGTWVEVPFEKVTLDTDRLYTVILEKYGDASNTIEWEYLTSVGGGTGQFWDSANFTSWSSQTGDFTLRTYPQRAINLILHNVTAARRFGVREKILPLRDLPDEESAVQLLSGISSVYSKQRRILPPLRVSPPDKRIPVGSYCRIRDVNGLDTKADIIGVDVTMNTSNASAMGATEVVVTVQSYT